MRCADLQGNLQKQWIKSRCDNNVPRVISEEMMPKDNPLFERIRNMPKIAGFDGQLSSGTRNGKIKGT